MKTLLSVFTILVLGILPAGSQPTNRYAFYGVRSFDSGGWLTLSNGSQYEYPWIVEYDPPLGGGSEHGRESYLNYPAGTSGNSILYYQQLTNNFDQYGDPKPHQLNFWYTYTLFRSNDGFQCHLSSTLESGTGILVTNLPVASSYRWVSLSIPPVPSGTPFPMLIFHVFRGASEDVNRGPTVYLDPSVQWYSIDTPIATRSDFISLPAGPGSVKVTWNTAAYKLGRWHLQASGQIAGPYTNTTASVQTTNSMAYVVLPVDSVQFYRLAHY